MGSRPGGLIATAWAAMVYTGESGYLQEFNDLLTAARELQQGIRNIDGLNVLYDPKGTVFAIVSTDPKMDIFMVGEYMHNKAWHIEKNQRPNALHVTTSMRHTVPQVRTQILKDFRDAVAAV